MRWLLILLAAAAVGCAPGPFFPDAEVDVDGDGVVPEDGDCDDREPAAFPAHPEICDGIDNDCDGAVDGADPDLGDQDADGVDACADCDDADASSLPGATELCDGADNDCDGVLPADESDDDGDLVMPCAGDCDDTDDRIHPGAVEACDGVDNDCSGTDDEADADNDGAPACVDCDDLDATAAPGLAEACDGVDNDCDGSIDAQEEDDDADGVMPCAGDCDDGDATRWPDAPELCNGVDDDCDTVLPADELDADSDGVMACDGDCDDGDASIAPGLQDLCDGVDTDCDGQLGAPELDSDGDGVTVCAGDCDDTLASVLPGASEICDGADTDCIGGVPADELDADGDGQMECTGDCDDGDAARFDGNPEVCDGLDNDCDAVVPADEADDDGDGERICAGDCDDGDSTRSTLLSETCDGVDNDCDSFVPVDEADDDGDGQRICAGDCDDDNAAVATGNTELCDGFDNDCDTLVDDDDLPDGDGDGDGPCVDCDDANGAVGPSTAEVCGNNVDDDCDFEVDEAAASLAAPALLVFGGASLTNTRFEPTDAVWSATTGVEVGIPIGSATGSDQWPVSLMAIDVDEDQQSELYSYFAQPTGASALVGQEADCTGAWQSLSYNPGSAFIDERLGASGDLDGDGFEDLLVFDSVTGATFTYLGTDDGPRDVVSGATGQLDAAGVIAVAPRVVDLDGDGDTDVLACTQLGALSTCSLYPGLGDGTLAAGQPFAVLALDARSVALGDMDGDGDQDLLLGMAADGDVWLLDGDGLGGFGLPTLFFDVDPADVGAGQGGLAAFDADGDGDDDLALVWDADPTGSALRNLQVVRKDSPSGAEVLSAIATFPSSGTIDGLDPVAVAP